MLGHKALNGSIILNFNEMCSYSDLGIHARQKIFSFRYDFTPTYHISVQTVQILMKRLMRVSHQDLHTVFHFFLLFYTETTMHQ